MSVEFESRVKSRFADMGKTDQAIATYLLGHSQEACRLSSPELAQAIGVSKSAITRFVKLVGYDSLREMRVQMASSATLPAIFFDDFEKDSTLGTAQSVFEHSANSLIETMSALKEEDLDAAVELLGKANLCGLFGTGGSYPILYSAFHRFQRTSLRMLIQPDLHMQLEVAANLTANDCALMVSHSGRNKDDLRVIKILKKQEVPLLLITSNPISPIAELSDVVVCSVADETKFRPEAITSTAAQMVLVDTLFTLYAMRVDKSPERFANIRSIIKETRI